MSKLLSQWRKEWHEILLYFQTENKKITQIWIILWRRFLFLLPCSMYLDMDFVVDVEFFMVNSLTFETNFKNMGINEYFSRVIRLMDLFGFPIYGVLFWGFNVLEEDYFRKKKIFLKIIWIKWNVCESCDLLEFILLCYSSCLSSKPAREQML